MSVQKTWLTVKIAREIMAGVKSNRELFSAGDRLALFGVENIVDRHLSPIIVLLREASDYYGFPSTCDICIKPNPEHEANCVVGKIRKALALVDTIDAGARTV